MFEKSKINGKDAVDGNLQKRLMLICGYDGQPPKVEEILLPLDLLWIEIGRPKVKYIEMPSDTF